MTLVCPSLSLDAFTSLASRASTVFTIPPDHHIFANSTVETHGSPAAFVFSPAHDPHTAAPAPSIPIEVHPDWDSAVPSITTPFNIQRCMA
jgi:hypothetical protein